MVNNLKAACELALAMIFEQRLPMNPKQVITLAMEQDSTITSSDVMAYMHEMYGWNESFYVEPMYSHQTNL